MYFDKSEIVINNRKKEITAKSDDLFCLNTPGGSWISSPARLFKIFRIVSEQGLKYNSWFFKYQYFHLFMFDLLPIILLGRFFNRKLIIEFDNAAEYFCLEQKQLFFDWVLKQADQIIVRTEIIKRNLLRRGINARAIPFQSPAIKFDSRVVTEVQPKILYAGYIEKITDVESILKAFGFVKEKYPRAEMRIYGQGTLSSYWQEMIQEQNINSVDFIAEDITDINSLFEWADLFLNYYYVEYQSQYLLSAFCLGLPVISSPLGYHQGLDNNKNIMLVPFNKPAEIARRVFDLIEQPEKVELLSISSNEFGQNLIRQNLS